MNLRQQTDLDVTERDRELLVLQPQVAFRKSAVVDIERRLAVQFDDELVGIAMAWAVAGVGTIVLLKLTDLVGGVRVREEQEIEGLDLTEHGEEAYNLEM